MPDLDLGPDKYRFKTKNGRWLVRDYPWMIVGAALVGAFFVGFAWWNRAELTTATLFGMCAMFSFFFGMAFAIWIKRFD